MQFYLLWDKLVFGLNLQIFCSLKALKGSLTKELSVLRNYTLRKNEWGSIIMGKILALQLHC